MGRRKKKSIRQEYTEGLRHLAFGEIQDAVRLLYAPEEQILPALGEMDLFNISEIKRPKGGGMEIKFFDRLKALEKLQALEAAEGNTAAAFYQALEAGAKGAITVAVACAMAGMIAGCITVTGLASILINAIVQMAGDATMIGLLLTMICCIILGMGVPTTANYCIMASTCAPILVQMDFPLVAAHFFVFYFGIVADITPPVALAAYAGAAIAKANPMKTGINATKLAVAAFIVPYIFAYSPAMLFDNVSSAFEVVQIVVSALIGLFGVAAALNGFVYKKIPMLFRLAMAAGGPVSYTHLTLPTTSRV